SVAGLDTATAAVRAITIVGWSGPAGAAPGGGSVRLAGSAAPFTSGGRVTGAVGGPVRLTSQVWLRPGHADAAARYATAVSTPGSSLFGRYLSPAAYTARFGASRAGAAAVGAWLHHRGLTGVHADAQRNYVRATGAVAAIDAAFQIREQDYPASSAATPPPYPPLPH